MSKRRKRRQPLKRSNSCEKVTPKVCTRKKPDTEVGGILPIAVPHYAKESRLKRLLYTLSKFFVDGLGEYRDFLRRLYEFYEMRFFWIVGIPTGIAFVFIAVKPINGPHTILSLCLFWSVILVNAYVDDWKIAKRRYAVFCALAATSMWAGNLIAFLSVGATITVFVLAWAAATLYGFALPLYRSGKTVEARPYLHVAGLLLFTVLFGVGSIYIPMRSAANGFVQRAIDPRMKKEIADDVKLYGQEQANLRYQLKHLYRLSEPEPSACSTFLLVATRPFLRQDEIALHATVGFWMQQFIGSIWGTKEIGGCWLSKLDARRAMTFDYATVVAYNWFLNFVWFALFTSIIWNLLMTRPAQLARAFRGAFLQEKNPLDNE